jgi:glutamate-1-semialdehyde 2,1-aminomutase
MPDRFAGSRRQHERARRTLAGGVATAFRAGQQPVPICFTRGEGTHLWDVDGNRYVDYNLAFGPMLQGHSPQAVLEAVQRQLATGLGYGASHPLEAELGEAVCRVVPSAEQCVFNSTGSEAVHVALRIARSATGRRRVIKFAGHYHGWFDPVHIGLPGQAGRVPGTGGQDPDAASSTIVCPWNDVDALRAALTADVAAVIMEPINVNGGCILPQPGYLAAARDLIRRAGAVLIFDEVITGFRVALGGAQEYYGITPDLTVLGKALGAGFPVSAVCGARSVMDEVASSRVAHVGTFNLNPVCAAAALAAVGELERNAADVYPRIDAMTRALADLVVTEAHPAGLALTVNATIGTAHASAGSEAVETHEDAARSDTALYRRFVAALLAHGVHTIPRGTWFMSTEHTAADLETTRRAVRKAATSVAAMEPAGGV